MTRMITEVIHFEPIGLTVTKSRPCPSCGKRVRRQRRFQQTLNPYNRAHGIPKTAEQILDEERARAAEWKAQAETCTPCLEATP